MQLCLMNPREDDTKWPQKNKDGRQELEIRLGNEHISFEVLPAEEPQHSKFTDINRLLKSVRSST
jgi:hypothetical protein